MLSTLLFCLSAVHAKVPHKRDPPREAGQKLYQDNCWQCHGERGLGDGPLSEHIPSPPLAGVVSRPAFDPLVDVIRHGSGAMPAFSPVLDVTDARYILLWLEGLDPTTGLDPSIGADASDKDDERDPPADAPEGDEDEVKAND